MRLRPDALTAAQRAYESEMRDIGQVMRCETTEDSYGAPVESYVAGERIPCMFSFLSATERATLDPTYSVMVGRARLPLGTDVTRRDRFSVLERFGKTLVRPREFAIMGEPRETAAYLMLELSEVGA